MATKYFGVSIEEGRRLGAVTVDTSTTSSDIELAVDDTNGPTDQDVSLALEALRKAILEQGAT